MTIPATDFCATSLKVLILQELDEPNLTESLVGRCRRRSHGSRWHMAGCWCIGRAGTSIGSRRGRVRTPRSHRAAPTVGDWCRATASAVTRYCGTRPTRACPAPLDASPGRTAPRTTPHARRILAFNPPAAPSTSSASHKEPRPLSGLLRHVGDIVHRPHVTLQITLTLVLDVDCLCIFNALNAYFELERFMVQLKCNHTLNCFKVN